VTSRRVVRVDQSFFDELDAQLGPDRGPGGEPSSTDFLTFDLPTIVDEFADNFDRCVQRSVAETTIEWSFPPDRSSLLQSWWVSSWTTTRLCCSASR